MKIKRFYISAVLIIFILITAFVENCVYVKKVNSLIEAVDSLSQISTENQSDILKTTRNFSETWRKSSTFFDFFLSNDICAGIDKNVDLLLFFAQCGDYNAFQQSVAETRCDIIELLQYEELKFENIF